MCIKIGVLSYDTINSGLDAWFGLNRSFSLVKEDDIFGDLNMEAVWRNMITDLEFLNIPPLFVVYDLMHINQSHKAVLIDEIGLFKEELRHSYRNMFLYTLIHRDKSILALYKILIAKGRRERRFFVPFMVRESVRRISSMHVFPFEPFNSEYNESSGLIEAIDINLPLFLGKFLESGSMYTDEQIAIFTYVRKEEDVPIIKEYNFSKKMLEELSPVLARKARSSYSSFHEVEDTSSPSMGGFCGISSGGDIEKITSIVPSELAMMESGFKVDVFDVNLVENRLLSFARDHYIDSRKRREFHIIFLSPDSMDYKPYNLPFRWQFLFLAILFDIISFYRVFFGLKHFPFYFVFPDKIDQSLDVFSLLDMVHANEFSDLCIKSFYLKEDELKEYMDDIVNKKGSNQSICCFSRKGCNMNIEVPHDIDLISLKYGGSKGIDEVSLEYSYKAINKRLEFLMGDTSVVGSEMNRIRDMIFLAISGAI